MRLRFPDGWVDFDLNLFADVACLVDDRLDEIEDLAKTNPGLADGLDYPLRHEHMLGIGFVAAQSYLSVVTAEKETARGKALSVGPRHDSGMALAQLINHGANYWKHADEWDWQTADARRDLIVNAFEAIGMAEDEMSLYGLLVQITRSSRPRLRDISPILEQWHDALEDKGVRP